MEITLSHTIVPVRDQDEALAFYRDVLGLELRYDVPFAPDARWLTLSPPGQPDVQIVLEPVGLGRPESERETLRELMAAGPLASVIFATPDVDAVFARVTAGGAEVMQPPTDQEYGMRDCAVYDPSGNHVRFGQPLPE